VSLTAESDGGSYFDEYLDEIVYLGLPRVLLTVGVWGDQAASASL